MNVWAEQEAGIVVKVGDKMMGKKKKIFAVAVLIMIILPFILISFYSRPSADDYSYGKDTYHLIKNGGWNVFGLLKTAFETDIRFYNSWQGLYSAAFIESLQPGIFGEKFYFIGALLLFLLMYISIYAVLRNFSMVYSIEYNKFIISLGILAFIMIGIPSTSQGFYWFNGAWNYMPFFCLTLLNVSFIFRFINEEKGQGNFWKQAVIIIISSILSFIISGGNHVTSFFNLMFLFVSLILAPKGRRGGAAFSFVIAVIGFAIMCIAPGTAVRMSRFERPSVINTMIRSASFAWQNFCDWLDIGWYCLILLFIPVGRAIKSKMHVKPGLHPLVILLVSSVMYCGCLCVPYYAMGSFGDARVINMDWLIFSFLLAVNIIYFYIWILFKYDIDKYYVSFMNKKRSNWIKALLFAGVFLGTGALRGTIGNNFISVTMELCNGQAAQYAQQCDERYEMIRNADKDDSLCFEPLYKNRNLYFDDISMNPKHWTNESWKSYYGVTVRLSENLNR